jgi:DnaJ-class molecular chaperone
MAKRDFYDILGVAKGADEKALKMAYRNQAKKYHPDANPSDKSMEAKFKEVNEAYDVLKDPQKKAAYDRFGHQAFENGAGGRPGAPGAGFGPDFGNSMSDIFEDLFGDMMGGGRGGQRKPSRASRHKCGCPHRCRATCARVLARSPAPRRSNAALARVSVWCARNRVSLQWSALARHVLAVGK